jgi:hypothetical protein
VESLEKLRDGFGSIRLPKALLDLILPTLNISMQGNSSLQGILEATRGQHVAQINYIGGNIATLLVNLDNTTLENQDLSHTAVSNSKP